MNKKGAIELSMNFFVILIISIVVFGSGMALFWTIYEKGEEQLDQVGRNVESQILEQLHGGSKTSIVPRQVTMQKDKTYPVGIGVNNIDPDMNPVFKVYSQLGLYFKDDVSCSFSATGTDPNCITHNFDELDEPIPELKIIGAEQQRRVELNSMEVISLMIKTDKRAREGDYVINVCVCADESDTNQCDSFKKCSQAMPYDSNHPISKIRVKVI